MEYVTKELLLNGIKHVEEVETPLGIFKIRPLSDGEKARVQSITVKGIMARGKRDNMMDLDVTVDMEAMVLNEAESRFQMLAYGLSAEKTVFTVADVKNCNLDPAIRDRLLAEIRRISGLPSGEEALRRFREQQARPGISGNNS